MIDLSKFAENTVSPDDVLCYAYCDGVYFLDNPIALMYATARGLPGCTRDWAKVTRAAIPAGLEVTSDDADLTNDQVLEHYDAALKVLQLSLTDR